MKYEFLYEIPSDSSLGKFLAQIKPGSTVLECGCASGYMTKILKEKLNCQVYIVEYSPEGFNNAKQYAVDGICGDLMQNHWKEKFAAIKFDYVLFADVLEHLADPLQVLRSATALLKDDGYVMVSLPNIGHNDIVTKLLQGNWDYTATGLLDDTHIHFWGINNLDNFFQDAGLGIVIRDCTTIPTGRTEQYNERNLVVNDEIYAVIKNRPEGEIYQFALILQKKEYLSQNHVEHIDRFPVVGSPSLNSESLQDLQKELLNKTGHIQLLLQSERELKANVQCKESHIEQLLQSERELQGTVRNQEAHIEQLLQSERDLLAENEKNAASIRQLQYDLGYQTSMADHFRKSEQKLQKQLEEACRIVDRLQYELGRKVSENRLLQENQD